MNTQTPFDDLASIERELAFLAPQVRQSFERLGGPSERTEQAIRDAARHAAAKQARHMWPRLRILAAAAGLAMLLGGSLPWFAGPRADRPAVPPARPAAAATGARADESAAGFASLLMEIQGLNEETFFRTEEAESLWL